MRSESRAPSIESDWSVRRLTCILAIALLILSTDVQSFKPVQVEHTSFTNYAHSRSSADSVLRWNKTYGGTGEDLAMGLVQTAEGGYVLAGRTDSYGAGVFDFWMVKTDANGNHVWNETYGGSGMDDALALIQASNGGYVLTGRTYSYGAGKMDFWLVKTDPNGSRVWDRTYGGAGDDRGYALIQTADEGFVLAGLTSSYGAGGSDILLIKTDADGSVQWNQTYGGTGEDYAGSVIRTSDGGYALVGGTGSFGAGGNDFWLIKTDENGVIPESQSTMFLIAFPILNVLAMIFSRRKRWTLSHQSRSARFKSIVGKGQHLRVCYWWSTGHIIKALFSRVIFPSGFFENVSHAKARLSYDYAGVLSFSSIKRESFESSLHTLFPSL